MPKAKPADAPESTVLPVPGAFLTGVPAAPIACDAATAERLIATGAFIAGSGDAEPISPEALAALDFYAPALPAEPPAPAADSTPEV